MNFPKASSLRLPKILLNGSPFHSPVELLIAFFSSRKAAQLNQQEVFRTVEGCREVFAAQRKMFFSLPDIALQVQRGNLVSELYFSVIAILRGSRSVPCSCKLGNTEA